MYEALKHATNFMFYTLNIHTICANYMPHNTRSKKLLARLGFSTIGLAKKYLYINDRWQDHILTTLVNADFKN